MRLWMGLHWRHGEEGVADRRKLRGPKQRENDQESHPAWPLGMPQQKLKHESSRLRALGLFTKEVLGWNKVSVRVKVI